MDAVYKRLVYETRPGKPNYDDSAPSQWRLAGHLFLSFYEGFKQKYTPEGNERLEVVDTYLSYLATRVSSYVDDETPYGLILLLVPRGLSFDDPSRLEQLASYSEGSTTTPFI